MRIPKNGYIFLLIGLFASNCSTNKEVISKKPNITFIISDDQAYDNLFFIWYAPFLSHTSYTTEVKYWTMVEWFNQTAGEFQGYPKEKGLDILDMSEEKSSLVT